MAAAAIREACQRQLSREQLLGHVLDKVHTRTLPAIRFHQRDPSTLTSGTSSSFSCQLACSHSTGRHAQ